ncbi:glycoside hydrolase domain-containing protein [Granulicella sibirica]|nr:glycoside hydrolase domain-containing protein [Granulicella sibirica]
MRVLICGMLMLAGLSRVGSCGGRKEAAPEPKAVAAAQDTVAATRDIVGFDRNDYPGDDAMAGLKKQFAYTGYWLTPPPGETANGWHGKRAVLRGQGYGFLVLANGRLDKEIKASKLSPAELGKQDAAKAVAAAKTEGFPAATIIFLDQEEGGRLLEEQAGYLFGWTEAVATTGFRPGVYGSGQPLPDGPGATITTIQDIREHVAKNHLHTIAIWAYQDACAPKGPSPGCTVQPPSRNASGTPDVTVWQYAQSPRRPDLTQSCTATYETDGNCYAPGVPGLMLDMNVAGSTDPSAGR